VVSSPDQRVSVKRPLFIAAPHDCIEDIIPDMLPEYVPVIVWPSSDIWAWPSTDIEQDDIMPLKPLFGTATWNVTVEPLMVPCIGPLPIMLRPPSLMFIVPVMALPFWARVQVMFPGPLVSADVPVHVPDTLVSVPVGVGVGAAGEDVLPPHADTVSRLKTTRIDVRMARSSLGSRGTVDVGCPTSHYSGFTRRAFGDTESEPLPTPTFSDSTSTCAHPDVCPPRLKPVALADLRHG